MITVHANVTINCGPDPTTGDMLAAVFDRLDQLGAQMSDIQSSLDSLADQDANLAAQVQLLPSRVAEDVGNFQAIIAQLGQELTDALSNAAADAATIAEKQAMIDDLNAQAQAAVDRINEQTLAVSNAASAIASVDPDPSFPAAPPADTVDGGAPADTTGGGVDQPVDTGDAVSPTSPPADEGFRGRRT